MMSSHDPFELLGLDRRTATDKDAKVAYAALLKQTRPEDDREGFMALRDAFASARSEIRWRDEYDEDEDEDYGDADTIQPRNDLSAADDLAGASITDVDNPANITEPSPDHSVSESTSGPAPGDYDRGDLESVTPEPITSQQLQFNPEGNATMGCPVEQALEDIKALIKSPFGVRQWSYWSDILERDELQSIDEYQRMSQELQHLLCLETGMFEDDKAVQLPGWLSYNVMKQLDDRFGWTSIRSLEPWQTRISKWIFDVLVNQSIKEGLEVHNNSTPRHKSSIDGSLIEPPVQLLVGAFIFFHKIWLIFLNMVGAVIFLMFFSIGIFIIYDLVKQYFGVL